MNSKIINLFSLLPFTFFFEIKFIIESKKVFGVELGVISGRLGAPTKWTVGTIPKFLKDIFEHLEKDGIFLFFFS